MIDTLIENTVGDAAKILYVISGKNRIKYKNTRFDVETQTVCKPKGKYDFILIDADNTLSGAKKNFAAAVRALNTNGVVVLANTTPPNQPRYVAAAPRPGNWYGEVWKIVYGLNFNDKTDFATWSVGNGYTVVVNHRNPNVMSADDVPKLDLSYYTQKRIKMGRVLEFEGLINWYCGTVTKVTTDKDK